MMMMPMVCHPHRPPPALDHREPHSAQPKDRRRRAALDVQRVPRGAQAGGHPTAQQGANLLRPQRADAASRNDANNGRPGTSPPGERRRG